MTRNLKLLSGLILIAAAAGIGTYTYATRPTKAPTQPIENAVKPIDTATTTKPIVQEPRKDGTFRIISERSKATFTLGEILRGSPVTVVGTTNQVAGEIQADRTNLSALQIGTIRVNARTFVTDNPQRNNAIQRMILKSENDANEFIEFVPKNVTGTPATAEIGQTFDFQVTGDLLVSGSTKEVTFKGKGTFVQNNELSGNAETTVHYPDFGISIPQLPFLADVDEDVKLTIEFVATR